MSRFTILGYPRSGANWLRYIIQRLLEDDAPLNILKANNSSACVKTHEAKTIKYPTTVILILRDYKDAISSHVLRRKHGRNYRPFARVENIGIVKKEAAWYLETLEAFDKIEEPKLVVHYEDLLLLPGEVIPTVGNFIGCSEDDLRRFLFSLDDHYATMMEMYNKVHGRYSSGHIGFYGQHNTREALEAMREILGFGIGKKYLGRYL